MAFSLRMQRGVDGFRLSDITIGADAPTTPWHFEFRFQVLDANAHPISRLDIERALKAYLRFFATVNNIALTPTYAGLGDVLGASMFSGYWGLRAFSFTTIGTKAVQLRRSSDSATMDAVTLSNGMLDEASITAFKGPSTLTVAKFYDQTGNGNDALPVDSEQAFTQNVLNGFGVYSNLAPNATRGYNFPLSLTDINTFSQCMFGVYKTTSVVAKWQTIIAPAQNEIALLAGDGSVTNAAHTKNEGVALGNDFIDVPATDGVWHALAAVINQTTGFHSGIPSSIINVDNVSRDSLDLVGNPGASDPFMYLLADNGFGTNELQGYCAEMAWFQIAPPGAPWDATQLTALIANAKAFWGI